MTNTHLLKGNGWGMESNIHWKITRRYSSFAKGHDPTLSTESCLLISDCSRPVEGSTPVPMLFFSTLEVTAGHLEPNPPSPWYFQCFMQKKELALKCAVTTNKAPESLKALFSDGVQRNPSANICHSLASLNVRWAGGVTCGTVIFSENLSNKMQLANLQHGFHSRISSP